jgi:hypothetical protein
MNPPTFHSAYAFFGAFIFLWIVFIVISYAGSCALVGFLAYYWRRSRANWFWAAFFLTPMPAVFLLFLYGPSDELQAESAALADDSPNLRRHQGDLRNRKEPSL